MQAPDTDGVLRHLAEKVNVPVKGLKWLPLLTASLWSSQQTGMCNPLHLPARAQAAFKSTIFSQS